MTYEEELAKAPPSGSGLNAQSESYRLPGSGFENTPTSTANSDPSAQTPKTGPMPSDLTELSIEVGRISGVLAVGSLVVPGLESLDVAASEASAASMSADLHVVSAPGRVAFVEAKGFEERSRGGEEDASDLGNVEDFLGADHECARDHRGALQAKDAW